MFCPGSGTEQAQPRTQGSKDRPSSCRHLTKLISRKTDRILNSREPRRHDCTRTVGPARGSFGMLGIGTMSLTSDIRDYDPQWPALFEAEKLKIRKSSVSLVREIHHVGSTAVPA